jgi:hypothetical protein
MLRMLTLSWNFSPAGFPTYRTASLRIARARSWARNVSARRGCFFLSFSKSASKSFLAGSNVTHDLGTAMLIPASLTISVR